MSGKTWSDAEIATVRDKFADADTLDLARQLGRTEGAIRRVAYNLRLKKSDEYMKRINDPITGNKKFFVLGRVAWNKGMRGATANKASFKKGRVPQNYVPVGSTVKTSEGYWKIKVSESGAWCYLHRKNWEDINGPLLDGFVLTFANGDRDNCDISNLRLTTKREIMKENNLYNLPEELVQIINIRRGINKRINHIERKKNEK